jgi:assimilatory nitrate reductase catalytic subunit
VELQAVVAPTIRPDTIFIPFHYGPEGTANLLTNNATDPTCKIPEYKACAATVERLDTREPDGPGQPQINYTPESTPKMFPYAIGESRTRAEQEAKRY